MEKNKATRPDKIPIEFYQCCWDIIKEDIIQLFDVFYLGTLEIKRLNYGIITLLPKVTGAERIQQYRPICLLNCLYKWFTKVMTIRIEPVAHKIIQREQTAFIKGRNIMTGVLSLHEIMHQTKITGKVGIILKLDFEKAYDKVNWEFMFKCIKAREVLMKPSAHG